jgi:hypothetical protein
MVDLDIPVKNKKNKMRSFIVLCLLAEVMFSCKPTKKIQTAINKKDSVEVVHVTDHTKVDSVKLISDAFRGVLANHIDFTTFSAKVNVDYVDADDKKYNVNAFIHMYKDSTIWVSVNAIFGIEALRAYITRDSVKILDKQNKLYTARSIKYLQDVTALPLDLHSLQDLIIGNPVFLDTNVVSYTRSGNTISLLSVGNFFKNLVTIDADNHTIIRSKLDDANDLRSRTCDLTYSDYENKKGVNFSTQRKITVAEQKKLDIRLDFKQYSFNEQLSFPFSVPKNYKRN